MIRFRPGTAWKPRAAYGWQILLDQSRLLCWEESAADAATADGSVLVQIVDDPASHPDTGRTEGVARALAALLETHEARAAVRLRPFDADDRALGAYFGVQDGVVSLARSVLLAVADLAGLRDEQRSDARDRHGRVPAAANPLVQWRLERAPVVALAGYVLREAVRLAAGRRPVRTVAPWPDGWRWAVSLTHDLDVVDYWPVFTGLRLAELARKRRLADVGRVLGAAVRPVRGGHVVAGAHAMIAAERARGVRSTWYLLAGAPTLRGMAAGDVTYRLQGARAGRLLDAARRAGAEFGLHGSFATYDSAPRFAEERAHVAGVTGAAPPGVRQHYLRFLPGRSQRAMQEAGFRYDASVGFADRNGFRTGVADVIPAWDEQAGAPLDFDLVPFQWMDRALSKYAGVESPRAWVDDALDLAARTRLTEGLWSGLWHPNLVPALGYPGAPPAYEQLLDGLVAERPFNATSAELLAWRRVRRSCRAVGVRPDGTVAFTAVEEAGNHHPIVLEDAAAQPAPSIWERAGAETGTAA